jgi:hypothetical protein
MSRDPSRELDHFRDALYAKAERDAEERGQEQQPSGHPHRSFDHERHIEIAVPVPAPAPRSGDSRNVLYDPIVATGSVRRKYAR